MALKKLTLTTVHDQKGKRLDQVLADWLVKALPQVQMSKGKVRKLIVAGAVYLNGKRVRIASKELQTNAKIDVYVDILKLKDDGPGQDKPFVMEARHVLFEDDFLIAVNKPPGLPTQPTLDEARDNLFAAVKRYLAGRDGVGAYVGLHHRLDRDTSGVVLFTKAVAANAGVAELFSKHLALKTYHAICELSRAPTQKQWRVENYLGRAQGSGKRAKFGSVRSGGDAALTDFRLLESAAGGFYVEAKPKTGRTHQIRVHLSEGGSPILGDETYGSRVTSVRLMLHAANLTFPHPITKVDVSIQSPLPEDFTQCLQQIRKGLPPIHSREKPVTPVRPKVDGNGS